MTHCTCVIFSPYTQPCSINEKNIHSSVQGEIHVAHTYTYYVAVNIHTVCKRCYQAAWITVVAHFCCSCFVCCCFRTAAAFLTAPVGGRDMFGLLERALASNWRTTSVVQHTSNSALSCVGWKVEPIRRPLLPDGLVSGPGGWSFHVKKWKKL